MDAGIRGTNIAVSGQGVPAEVTYVEQIEADLYIHLLLGGEELIAVEKIISNDALRYYRGQKVFLTFDTDRIHLFDGAGNRI